MFGISTFRYHLFYYQCFHPLWFIPTNRDVTWQENWLAPLTCYYANHSAQSSSAFHLGPFITAMLYISCISAPKIVIKNKYLFKPSVDILCFSTVVS
jgi:hypothetical protein